MVHVVPHQLNIAGLLWQMVWSIVVTEVAMYKITWPSMNLLRCFSMI